MNIANGFVAKCTRHYGHVVHNKDLRICGKLSANLNRDCWGKHNEYHNIMMSFQWYEELSKELQRMNDELSTNDLSQRMLKLCPYDMIII
jgi:hypothetical protein